MTFRSRYRFLLLFLLALPHFIFGQSQKLFLQEKDSLLQDINSKKTVEEKLTAYKKAFQYFARQNPTIAQEFAQKALDLAKQEKALKQQLGFTNNLGLTYVIQRDYPKALEVFNDGLVTADKPEFIEEYLFLKHRIASVWLKQGKKEQAAQLLDSIISVAKYKKLIKSEGMAVTEMGKLERINGNYDKSLQYFQRNLEIAKQLNHKGQIAYTYLQIAIDYDKTGEQEKALSINRKGLALANEIKNNLRLLDFYNNIAINFRNLKQYDSAFHYHSKVLDQHKKQNNPFELARSFMNFGTTYTHQKYFDKALIYYDSAYILVKNKKGHALLGTITQNLSALYQDRQEYRKSIKFGNQALAIAKQRKQTNEFFNIYENLYQSYKGLSKPDSALFYHEKMTASRDSIYSLNKNNTVEKIKREIETSENQLEKQSLAIKNSRNTFILLSIIGALASSLILIYLWGLNSRRKKKIAIQNQLLEEQKVLCLIQDQEFNAVSAMIEGQEKERQKIAEEIHDSLGSSLATLKLHTENLLINPKLSNEAKNKVLNKINKIIDETYQKVRNISHLKSNTMVEQKGLIMALEKLSNQINTDDNIQVHIDVFGFEKLAKNSLKILIYNSIQELLTNAIKHAKASLINIQITQHENELNILVDDNGKGFDTNKNYLENGIGLYQIKKKIESLNGTFLVDSTLKKGTTVNINIPL